MAIGGVAGDIVFVVGTDNKLTTAGADSCDWAGAPLPEHSVQAWVSLAPGTLGLG